MHVYLFSFRLKFVSRGLRPSAHVGGSPLNPAVQYCRAVQCVSEGPLIMLSHDAERRKSLGRSHECSLQSFHPYTHRNLFQIL